MTSADEIRTARIVIEGQVQGVWFRGWMQEAARRLGLSGWVRNRRDGSVEAVVSGVSVRVLEMIQMCETGPPSARVHNVRVTELDERNGAEGFTIRPTL